MSHVFPQKATWIHILTHGWCCAIHATFWHNSWMLGALDPTLRFALIPCSGGDNWITFCLPLHPSVLLWNHPLLSPTLLETFESPHALHHNTVLLCPAYTLVIGYCDYRPVTRILACDTFAYPKISQKCHFISVGLSPCDKSSTYDYFSAWSRGSHNIR